MNFSLTELHNSPAIFTALACLFLDCATMSLPLHFLFLFLFTTTSLDNVVCQRSHTNKLRAAQFFAFIRAALQSIPIQLPCLLPKT